MLPYVNNPRGIVVATTLQAGAAALAASGNPGERQRFDSLQRANLRRLAHWRVTIVRDPEEQTAAASRREL
jgi:hypothetical protein